MRIVIAGGGVAGLTTALTLARAGHSIELIERDDVSADGSACDAMQWVRKGIAHFLQPHAFLPRGRRELRLQLPDIYDALLRAGASDFSVTHKIQGKRLPADEDLVYLSVRRPVIEWALRRAVLEEPNVKFHSRTRIIDFIVEPGSAPRVRGVVTDTGESLAADLVLDAQGRTTSLPAKLNAMGCTLRTETANTHILYYSRYFQMQPGKEFPRGPWLITPRGDLGYAGYSSFTGDNGTFAIVFAVGAWDRELRVLQHAAAWDAVAASIPMLAPLVDPSFATPITPVLAMGELHNTLRHYVEDGSPRVLGLVPVGDTLCHTDPTFALGLSFSILHAAALRDALGEANSMDEVLGLFWEKVYPETRERYDYAVAADDARAATWRGEKLDYLHANGCYPLFTMVAAAMAAGQDDEIFRKTVRRIGFLDRMSVMDQDPDLHRRIEKIVSDLLKTHRVRPPMPRHELLEVTQKAMENRAINVDAAATHS